MSHIFLCIFVVSMALAHMCAGEARPKCEVNSEPRLCGKLCESTCEKPEKIVCKPADKDRCKYECRCVDGYVRHGGKCIKVGNCPTKPPKRCPSNESINLCGRLCEPSCTNPKPKYCPKIQCTKSTEGCRCNKGYLRNSATSKCVLPKHCPPKAN